MRLRMYYGSTVTLGTASFDYDGFFLQISPVQTSGVYRLRIFAGIGAPLITDYFFDGGAAIEADFHLHCPVSVPKGLAIVAQLMSNNNGGSIYLTVAGYQGDARMARGFSQAMSATDFSTVLPTNSLTLTGTTVTGWSTIQASSPHRFAGFAPAISRNGVSLAALNYRIDFGYGAPGSELTFYSWYFRSQVYPPQPIGAFIPVDFPAGTRFACRGVASGADTNVLYLGMVGLAA